MKYINLVLAILLTLTLVQATVTGSETMTRTAPSQVSPNQRFTVTYTAIGTSGNWGATIQDSVSGGCQFPAGTTYRDIWISDEGTTRTVTVTAPSSGSCTFSGDYKFGSYSAKSLSGLTVTVSGTGTTTELNWKLWAGIGAGIVVVLFFILKKK